MVTHKHKNDLYHRSRSFCVSLHYQTTNSSLKYKTNTKTLVKGHVYVLVLRLRPTPDSGALRSTFVLPVHNM